MAIKIVVEIEGTVDSYTRNGFEKMFDEIVALADKSFAPLHCWVRCRELQKKVELLDR